MRRTAAYLLYVMLITGCASLAPKIETPKLSLVGANMMSADLFNQQFRVRLHVDNPNARALPIKKIDYKLFLEGDSFAEGATDAPFVVPALDSTEFDLIVRTNFVSSLGRLMSRIGGENHGKIRYDFVGKLDVDIPLVPTLAFKESGVVDLGRR